jgi:hypothetical protein
VQEICPLRSTWRGLESTWESASDVAGLSRMAPVLDPTYSATVACNSSWLMAGNKQSWKQAELAGVEPSEVSFVASFNLQG